MADVTRFACGNLEKIYNAVGTLGLAAYKRDWENVRIMQDKLVASYAARVLAVRFIADTNSAAGIDGVKLTSDAQKMKMALSLTRRGYQPLPNRYEKVTERGKELTLHIPAARDKAMLVLYAFSLDPVAESTADKKSFFARKGRSAHDAYAYILQELNRKIHRSGSLKLMLPLSLTMPCTTGSLKTFLWIRLC